MMNRDAGKPRVMQIITRLIRGGAQEATLLIVQRLLKENYSVVLAHGPGDPELLKRLPQNHPDLEFLFIPEFRRRILPVYDLLAFWRLWRYLKKRPVDLVHTLTSKAGMLGRWAAFFAGSPAIVHSPHGSIYHPVYFNAPALNFFAALERQTARFTDKIVTMCESEKKDYLRYRIGSPEKFTTIYSGVEVERFIGRTVDTALKKSELKIPDGRPVIGYVARMTPEKGHGLCLEMFQRVLKAMPEAVLVLVGGGPLETQVRKRIRQMELEQSVVLTGPRSDIPEILKTFDCFVQTSLWDGLPLAMVEAMLAERAVVAAAVGGIPEVIRPGKTGMLVSEKDAAGMAAAVLGLLKNPETGRELGRQARRQMEEVFDVNASVEKLYALYDAVIELKNTRPLRRSGNGAGPSARPAEAVRLEKVPCPGCGSSRWRAIAEILLSPMVVTSTLVCCLDCRLAYVSPRPAREAEKKFYTQDHFLRETPEFWRQSRLSFFRQAIDGIRKRLFPIHGARAADRPVKILDVGCGGGFFLEWARREGWQCLGTELSEPAASYARRNLQLDVLQNEIYDAGLTPGSFDAVTLWNVLDQMPDPAHQLAAVFRLLRPGGVLALRVSNLAFHLALWRLWRELIRLKLIGADQRSPTVFHLEMFDPRSLAGLLIRMGFQRVEVENSVLDPRPRAAVSYLGGRGAVLAGSLLYRAAEALRSLSLGRLVYGPSLLAFARKPQGAS